jgi:hypothetical protein
MIAGLLCIAPYSQFSSGSFHLKHIREMGRVAELQKFWWLDPALLKGVSFTEQKKSAKQKAVCGVVKGHIDDYVTANHIFMPTHDNGMLKTKLHNSASFRRDKSRFLQSMQKSQDPAKCTAVVRKGGWSTGIGSEINGYAKTIYCNRLPVCDRS